MTACWFFGHKWKHKKRLSKDTRWGDLVSDPRMLAMWKEDFYDIYRCEYCRQNVEVPTHFRPDNSKREKWEKRSEKLKAILK